MTHARCVCCGTAPPPPPPPPGPCCFEGGPWSCINTNPAPGRPITVRLRGSYNLRKRITVSGPEPSEPPQFNPHPSASATATSEQTWNAEIDQTVVIMEPNENPNECPDYFVRLHSDPTELMGSIVIAAEAVSNVPNIFNPCRFGYYIGVREVSLAEYTSILDGNSQSYPVQPGSIVLTFSYAPKDRGAFIRLGFDPFDPEDAPGVLLIEAFAGSAAPSGSPCVVTTDASFGITGIGFGYPDAGHSDSLIENMSLDIGDRACNTDGAASWQFSETRISQAYCIFQGPPYQPTPAYYSEVIEWEVDASVSFEIIDGIAPCPDNVPCPALPPPPPPPPPPPASCCESTSGGCQPTDAGEFPLIDLTNFRARLFYSAGGEYGCTGFPGGTPSTTGEYFRTFNHIHNGTPGPIAPLSLVNYCPVYEREYSVDDHLRGEIFDGCSQAGFAFPPVDASFIDVRFMARFRYTPAMRKIELWMTLLQLVSGGGNTVRFDIPLALFSLYARVRVGATPEYSGEVRGSHRGRSLAMPGPYGPGEAIPVPPSNPPASVGGSPAAFGGWGFESYAAPCATAAKVVGNTLFVPTSDIIKGNGTIKDDVRYQFEIEVGLAGVELCDGVALVQSSVIPISSLMDP